LVDWGLVTYIVLAIAFQAITIGGVYALVSGALTLVWGSADFLNLSLGGFFALSAYSMYQTYVVLRLSLLYSTLLTLGLFFAVYFFLDLLLLRRFFRKKDASLSVLLVSLGVLIFCNGFYDTTLSYTPRAIQTPLSSTIIHIPGFGVPEIQVIAIVVEYALVIFLLYFIRYTKYGRLLRAMAQDEETANLMGADTSRLRSVAYLVSSMIVTLGGVLYGLLYSFTPSLVSVIMLPMVVIALVGGIGSALGSVTISLIFGVVGAVVSFYINPVMSVYVFYAIMFAVLLLRPRGLFRR
jgi:branched-chain amino acid transport system permease protein